MADTELEKLCRGCDRVLPFSAFSKRASTPSGVMNQCKECRATAYSEYRQSPHAKELKRQGVARYAQTEKGKLRVKIRDEKVDPLKREARKAARNAVAQGKLVKAACFCGEVSVDAHHLFGYDKPNWLAVAWLCRTHHLEFHYRTNEALAAAHSAGRREIEKAVIKKFDELCQRVRTEPNFGNSTKGKKDNFLDGAEVMLTEVQYQAALEPKQKEEL